MSSNENNPLQHYEKQPLFVRILLYTIPVMLSGILQLLFNAADTVVVGRFAGGDSMAAVGATSSLVNLIVNVFIGLSVGASVGIAQAWGAKNQESVRKLVHTSMLTSVFGGVIVMIIGVCGSHTFLSLMGTPDNVIHLSTLYMQIYFLGMPACMVYNFGAAILRSVGDTKRPLLFLTIAGVVNVILNLILVIVFHLGVAGVAIATAVSQTVSAVMVVISLMRQKSCYRLVLRELRIYPDKLWIILRVGLPAGIQGSIFSISNVVIQSSINSFGSIAVEGNTAASSLEGFVYTAMNSFYHAALTFVGQHVGAREIKKISRILVTCLVMVTVMGVTLGQLVYLFREPLLSIYRPNAPDVHAYGAARMQVVVVTYFLCGIMDVLTGTLRGMGASLSPMLISLIGVCATRMCWVYTVFAEYRSLSVLYLSYPVSWALTICCQIVAFFLIRRRLMRQQSIPD